MKSFFMNVWSKWMVLAVLMGVSTESMATTVPVAATDVASSWDNLYWFLIWVSVFFFVGIIVAMIVFAVKYNKNANKKPKYIHGHVGLEVLWTVIPTILVFFIFGWGWVVYKEMVTAPSNAMEVRVIGKQWLWQFVYSNGRTEIGNLYFPVNRPVKLIMSSEDVLHSFFIPNFRVKSDVVPGMYTDVWFEAKVPGIHQIFCTEYCGSAHSAMLGRAVALTPEQWQDWLAGKKIDLNSLPADPTFPGYRANMLGEGLPEGAAAGGAASAGGSAGNVSLAEKGKKLVQEKGCTACHSADGVKMVGPSYKGIFGTEEKMADGSTVKVDENYLRESIEVPAAKVVAGYAPSMPPYKGTLSEEEIGAIIEYIKSLK